MTEQKRPRGRPQIKNKRDKKITIRVTEEEYKKFQSNAKKCGYSLTEFIIKKTI